MRDLLEGLAALDPLLAALDRRGFVAWMSPAWAAARGGLSRCLGRPLIDLLLEQVDASDESGRSRLRELFSHLEDLSAGAPARRIRLGSESLSTTGRVEIRVSCTPDRSSPGLVLCSLRPMPAPDAASRASSLQERSGESEDPLSSRPCSSPLSSSQISSSQLSFVFDSTPDGVLTLDALGCVRSANQAAGRLLGHAPSDLIGHPIACFIVDPAKAEPLAARLATHGEIRAEEIEVAHSDGSRSWLSISARISARIQESTRTRGTSPGAPRGETVVFIRDVSERHEARRALESKNEELECYVRSVSHDLRSPLMALLGFTRLLRDEQGRLLDASGLHFLDRIEEAGRNIDRLLQDMLELSRIGAVPECRIQVDPRPVLLQIQAEQKLRLEERGLELSIPDSPPVLHCDRTRLYQVLSNLIGNAVEHRGPEPGGRIEVDVRSVSEGWEISVEDDGPGIAPEDCHRIFEMFQTARSSGRSKRSSGLGLAIVKKIVETHRGRIRVESEPGRGARFVAFLPAPTPTAVPDDPIAPGGPR